MTGAVVVSTPQDVALSIAEKAMIMFAKLRTPVLGIVDDSPWADLGTVSEYHRLNLELASGSFPWPGIDPKDGCILPPSVEPSAHVRQSIIGPEVAIAQGVTLDRCVVWSGAHVDASATRAVITPEHRIEVS